MRIISLIIIFAALLIGAIVFSIKFLGDMGPIKNVSELPATGTKEELREPLTKREPRGTDMEGAYENRCGSRPLPLRLREGVYFVPEEIIVAMKGKPGENIFWTGDNNNWSLTLTEFYVNFGQRGIAVYGSGPDHMRWNLYQEGYGNDGWLMIEEAYEDFDSIECKHIYSEGKILINGEDPLGIGPAFAEVQ